MSIGENTGIFHWTAVVWREGGEGLTTMQVY